VNILDQMRNPPKNGLVPIRISDTSSDCVTLKITGCENYYRVVEIYRHNSLTNTSMHVTINISDNGLLSITRRKDDIISGARIRRYGQIRNRSIVIRIYGYLGKEKWIGATKVIKGERIRNMDNRRK